MLFYSNEREPIHVHGKYQGSESKAELVIENGDVVDIRYGPVRGRRPLTGTALSDFEVLVEHFATDIIRKWIDYFVPHKAVQPEIITRRIR